MPRAYYNEIEPAAVHVLRVLIDENIIAPGDVDDRSIKEVRPSDLIGYTQCHFFAGGGLWSVAARMAGWPDERPIWTGSCPCQPFSVAGKGLGHADPRHLWPDFHRLITACKPPVVFGEQVAGAAGYDWFDGVSADLEREDYAAEAFDIPAAAVDAPHIRQRLYWIAAANSARLFERKQDYDVRAVTWQDARISSGGGRGGYGESGMADTDSRGHPRRPEASERGAEWGIAAERFGGSFSEPLWWLTKDGDATAFEMYRRHYSSSKNKRPKIKLFIGPGEKIVLRTASCDAILAWRKFKDDSGQSGVNCAVFRNESAYLSSELIRQADAIAYFVWPGERHYTFVDKKSIRSTNPGYCFKRAGWSEIGATKSGLIVLERVYRRMADTDSRGHPRRPEASERGAEWGTAAERIGGDVAYSNGAKPRRWQFGFQPWSGIHHGDETKQERASLWYDHEWRTGADGKARRVKPGLRLLADGVPGRVGLLRIAGNAIVPQLAAEVIKAFMESE